MDSLKKRYFVKLISSGSDALINLLLLLFVPRALGPAAYGNFNFIRELFQNIVSFSDLNLGSAHINHAARKEIRESFTSNPDGKVSMRAAEFIEKHIGTKQ